MKTKQAIPEKTSRNYFFYSPALHREMCSFETTIQLVPEFYSNPSCSLLELILGLLEILLLQLAVFNWSSNIY